MRLFILKPKIGIEPWCSWFGVKNFGFVVNAPSKKEARILAFKSSEIGKRKLWLNEDESSCFELLTVENDVHLILND